MVSIDPVDRILNYARKIGNHTQTDRERESGGDEGGAKLGQ